MNGRWTVIDEVFTEQWNRDDFDRLIACLRHTLQTGGAVFGAFTCGVLKGFTSVESRLFGNNRDYVDLSSIHVSRDVRGQGTGRDLFRLAANWARAHGARKLYISAHSSVETQAFYAAMGCVEAAEYSRAHAEKEPCDCQLEFPLYQDT